LSGGLAPLQGCCLGYQMARMDETKNAKHCAEGQKESGKSVVEAK
jgi:hypothetical protein